MFIMFNHWLHLFFCKLVFIFDNTIFNLILYIIKRCCIICGNNFHFYTRLYKDNAMTDTCIITLFIGELKQLSIKIKCGIFKRYTRVHFHHIMHTAHNFFFNLTINFPKITLYTDARECDKGQWSNPFVTPLQLSALLHPSCCIKYYLYWHRY